MSEKPGGTEDDELELTTDERIGRLQGIRKSLQESDIPYLDLTNIYEADPVANPPYVIQGTFISEEVGGSLTVIDDENEETLGLENTNQVLSNFLPGGYKKRWGNFRLWRGAWELGNESGDADIGPMFDWAESFPLTDLLGDVSEVDYTELSFDPSDVRIYIPRTIRVQDLTDPSYVWIPEKGIVWTGNPPYQSIPLSSDPTTNYLWFKHTSGDIGSGKNTPALSDSELVTGYSFDEDHEFVRCYYASLLTLYPRGTTRTQSGIIRYRVEEDDTTAFVGTRERSQLLTFELKRDEIQKRISDALATNPKLKLDLRFAFLHRLLWKRLFFEEEAIDHEFAISPLVEHLVGADFWRRLTFEDAHGVFMLSAPKLVETVEELLPANSETRLRLLGHDEPESSSALRTIREHSSTLAELLARCRNDRLIEEFAEEILVHSAEHALSTWATDLTGAGTSFELWYDLNFQARNDESVNIAVYDPIEGGAGIAKEVADKLEEESRLGIDAGLAAQGRCHSATADQATVNLLADFPDGSLYDIYRGDRDRFADMVEETVMEIISDPSAYNMNDLQSHVEQRTQRLFETRELATFYSYLAAEHEGLASKLGRTPRTADMALFLDRHVFENPSIRATYNRFTSEAGRKDIAELGERLEELTVQCITACPDCLQMDSNLCIRGIGHQSTTLNRRLLTEVFGR